MHGVYRSFGLSYTHPPTTAHAVSLAETFENEYLGFGLYLPRFFMFLPLFVGAFVGGPLIARELETGTFRFAWTQSVGRTRWTIAKLAILGLAVTAMALCFSQLFSWWYRPFEQLTGPRPRSRASSLRRAHCSASCWEPSPEPCCAAPCQPLPSRWSRGLRSSCRLHSSCGPTSRRP